MHVYGNVYFRSVSTQFSSCCEVFTNKISIYLFTVPLPGTVPYNTSYRRFLSLGAGSLVWVSPHGPVSGQSRQPHMVKAIVTPYFEITPNIPNIPMISIRPSLKGRVLSGEERDVGLCRQRLTVEPNIASPPSPPQTEKKRGQSTDVGIFTNNRQARRVRLIFKGLL